MTIFPDHSGLDRQDRLLVLQARLSDIATVVRLGCRMHPSKPGWTPGEVRPGGTGRPAIRAHSPGGRRLVRHGISARVGGRHVTAVGSVTRVYRPAPLGECSAAVPAEARERLLAQTTFAGTRGNDAPLPLLKDKGRQGAACAAP